MGAKPTQIQVTQLLRRVFPSSLICPEWSVRTGANDTFTKSNKSVYAPRLDIAVGPFNPTVENIGEDVRSIHSSSRHPLVQKIVRFGEEQNDGYFSLNNNPRCLLGIEIEWDGSSKHILGDYTNASMMGLIGVVIGFPKNLEKMQRVGQYARELRRLNKAPHDLFTNIVFFSADEFTRLLETEVRSS